MTRGSRLAVHGAALACLALIPIELGWVSWLRYAWGMNFWLYLPTWAALLLAAGVAALAWPRARTSLLRVLTRIPVATRWGAMAVVLGLPLVLWALREQRLYADSFILLVVAGSGGEFLFPDIGASYFFRVAHRLGAALGVPTLHVVQAFVCLAGGATVLCTAGVARLLAPTAGRVVAIVLLCLGGGLTRVMAGHVEVYAFVLVCASAYLWAALAHLRGRVGLALPSLALGLGIWMHLSCIFLAPSLLAAVWLTTPGRSLARLWPRLLTAGVLSVAPIAVFLAVMLAFGFTDELRQAWQTMLEWYGIVPSPTEHEAFLRPPFSSPGAGTRYVVFSGPHWKYLANAFFILAPAAVPLLLVFVACAPRRFVATPDAVVLTAACASMLVYTAVVRPCWGPYDWDLFSLTALCLAVLSAHLLVSTLDELAFAHVGILLIGTTLLVVTLPFVSIGITAPRPAGPFGQEMARPEGDESYPDAIQRGLGPWL